jgi:crotonobetainyl-CoA:carnitine CoA-transferase CaiB-like acyl-CoA transferase
MSGILDGIRVLDFSRYVAGPLCATVLGDFGAEIIRIERRGGGEDRKLVPVTADGEGAIFHQYGRNKRSITLDTRKADAAAVIAKLIASADVIVANVPPAALVAIGIDYERAKAIRPDIIHCNVSCFSKDGPWADRGGFDSIGQAMSGAAFLSGEPGHPIRQPTSWVDSATGLYAALGVVMALYERQRSGRGQQVEASLLGTAVAFNATYLIEQAMTGINRTAAGNRSFINGPTDLFTCSDGSIVTQVVSDALYRRWAKLMGEPEWLNDPRFETDEMRGTNGVPLSERMGQWCAGRTIAEAIDELAAAGIPAGPVLSPQQVLEHPQIEAMNLFSREHAGGSVPLIRTPIDLSETPPCIRQAATGAGADTRDILSDLGFTADEIEALSRNEVV